MRLAGKTAMITGASRNIGREIALTFAREGADLILNTRASQDELNEVASKCGESGVKTLTVLGDVSDAARCREMVAEGLARFGKIDVLVCGTGIRPHRPIGEVTDEEWQRVMAVNCFSAFYLSKAVVPDMVKRHSGSIIALGGQSAITGRPKSASVTAAKHGLLGLVRALAAELAPSNVRANMVSPGSTDTERAHPEWYPDFASRVSRTSAEHLKDLPMGRQATVQDIANAVLFFASEESAYVTGVQMSVMGGRYII